MGETIGARRFSNATCHMLVSKVTTYLPSLEYFAQNRGEGEGYILQAYIAPIPPRLFPL